MLRDYQRRAIDETMAWMDNNVGHPCLVMPTGAGKSHVVAAICKEAVTEWPETRILMLTHVKELIEQNAEKMRQHWQNAPLGIYSAGMRRRDLSEPITFAGIQSIRTRAADVGHVDLCLIDECHLVNHDDDGSYRRFLGELWAINPKMRLIGLTATPYRLGHGMITDKPALFDGLVEPVSIDELMARGFLCRLSCKATVTRYDTSAVHKRGGEFVESELQSIVNTDEQNTLVVDEIMAHGASRKSWLVFATGVSHAEALCATLRARGVAAECVTGETPKGERERILRGFKRGEIRAVTNANVLTTGFDAPGVDLIAFCRPTMSVALYMQMAGRGLRTAPNKADCLVLDFAGLVSQHGPITNPRIKAKKGEGDAPVKVCDACAELVHISAKVCPACGAPFPIRDDKPEAVRPQLVDVDMVHGVNPDDVVSMHVTEWKWTQGTSATSGKPMVICTYYGALSDRPVKEYFTIFHEGYAGQKAWERLIALMDRVSQHLPSGLLTGDDVGAVLDALNKAPPPRTVSYVVEGRWMRVTKKAWE